jgi:hypothetical protein
MTACRSVILIFSVLSLALVSACGGFGGGGGGATIPSGPSATATPRPTPTAGPGISVDADAAAVGTVSKDLFGVNQFAYENQSGAAVTAALQSIGGGLIRYPGGSTSDFYHWQANTYSSCMGSYYSGPVPSTGAWTFDQFMQGIPIPVGAHVAVTVNYGSNQNCTDGADPNEAAAWVDYANNTHHYGIKYWTIGNEQYFAGPQFTPDLHAPATAAEYASLVATQFYPLMKAKDPTIQIGVDLAAPDNNASSRTQTWDSTVLSSARYDFVEIHPTPVNASGADNDAFTLGAAVDSFATTIAQVRSELSAAGKPASTPIYIGEWTTPGTGSSIPRQQQSIVGGLYAAMVVGELLKSNVSLASFYTGWDLVCTNITSSDYGFQTFATWSLFDAVLSASGNGCPGATLPPYGTPFPAARALQLASFAFQPGDSVIAATVSNLPTVRAYVSKRASGYGFLMVNTDRSATVTVPITLKNESRTFTATAKEYGKAEYDQSKNNAWPGPNSTTIPSAGGSFSIALPPWSMTAITLN